jgi:hypothetical protein
MASRLSSLAQYHAQHLAQPHFASPYYRTPPTLPPPLSIRTPEELAAINSLLLQLGKSVANPAMHAGHSPFLGRGLSELEEYFTPSTLEALGIANMPGIQLGAGAHHLGHEAAAANAHLAALYGSAVASANSYSMPSPYSAAHHPTPPLSKGSLSPPSSNSAGGTPSVSPIPDMHHDEQFEAANANWLGLSAQPLQTTSLADVRLTPSPTTPSSAASASSMPDWASLRPSRSSLVSPQLGVPDFSASTLNTRVVLPLKSIPQMSPPSDMDMSDSDESSVKDDGQRDSRGSSEEPTPTVASSSRLYPLLTFGDPTYQLPPLRNASRETTRSPPSSPSSDDSSAPGSPSPPRTTLPSLASLSLDGSSVEDRIRHASFIQSLLVTINRQFRASQREDEETDQLTDDEEMTVVSDVPVV